jgi:hypothetical protein
MKFVHNVVTNRRDEMRRRRHDIYILSVAADSFSFNAR